MTSVQERLQLKRVALDKWSTREKLCLAAAVACSGDQNWMSVSRSIRMLCGANRPNDWFSQKSCAVQYGELLENADHPKRKKRTSSEKDSQTAETPTESILRKLTEERIAELEEVIVKTRKDYVKLKEDIMLIQSSNVTEAQLREMWTQCEKEDEEKRIEQQKYNQWLKEREERKTELQKSWRPGNFQNHQHLHQQQQQQQQKFLHSQRGQSSEIQHQQDQGQQQSLQVKSLQLNLPQKPEEMEVDDNPVASSKSSTSPLLTSLLKSTSPAPTSVANVSTNVRITAPTITNLLTGGTVTSQVQSLAASPSHRQKPYLSLNLKPLTGPSPTVEHPTQATPSPSQAAPTLSMLLENKNKEITTSSGSTETTPIEDVKTHEPISNEAIEAEEESGSPSKDDEQLMEVFKGLIPDNIEELADILTNNNAIILNPELLEEESILDGVESLIDEQEPQNEATNNESVKENPCVMTEGEQNKVQENKASKNVENKEQKQNVPDKIKVEMKEENEGNSHDMRIFSKPHDSNIKSNEDVKIEGDQKNVDSKRQAESLRDSSSAKDQVKEEKEIKVEKVESSDDSSDNTTLQMLRDKIQVDNKNEIDDEMDEKLEVSDEEVVMEINSTKEDDSKDEKESVSENEGNKEDMEEEKEMPKTSSAQEDSPPVIIVTEAKTEDIPEEPQKSSSESSDVIIIAEDDDSNENESDRVKEQLQTKRLEIARSPKTEIEARKTPVSEQNQLTSKETSTAKDTILPSSPKVTKMETETNMGSLSNTSCTNTTTGTIQNISNMDTTTITIIDTDEESPVEVIKDDKSSRSRRDYSRKKVDHSIEKKEESSLINTMSSSGPTASTTTSTSSTACISEESKQALSIRRLRERDGSESPLIEDDNADTIPRTRRRYSSTPVIDSIPSSPASSDDREYKAWKKSILMIYNRIAIHKHASLFLKPITEEMAPNYKNIVLRSMDLYTIKKNIENGNIRTTVEFQRDIMLMCQNAIMYNKRDNNLATMAREMMTESMNIIETITESIGKREQEKILSSSTSTSSSGIKSRTSIRKSTRLP